MADAVAPTTPATSLVPVTTPPDAMLRLARRCFYWACILLCPAIAFGYLVLGDEPFGGYLDEALALGAATSIAGWRVHRRHAAIFLFVTGASAAMAFIGLVSALSNQNLGNFPVAVAAPLTAFLDSKIVLAGLALAFFIAPAIDAPAKRAGRFKALILVFAIMPLLNVPFVLRDVFSDGVSLHGQYLMTRSGFYAAQGLFPHKFLSGICFAIGVIAAVSLCLQTGRARYGVVVVVYVIGTLLAQDLKSLLSELVFVVMAAWLVGRRHRVLAVVASVFVVAAAYLASSAMIAGQYERFVLGEFGANIRTVVWPVSMRLMTEYFPLGNGAGTFGSMTSYSLGYSPTYYLEGLAVMHGGGPQDGGLFLMDFMWPKFIAEYGVFGTIAILGIYLLLALRAFRATIAARRVSDTRQLGLAAFSLGMFIFFFAQSAALLIISVSFVVAPMATAIAIAIAGVDRTRLVAR